MFKFLKTTKPTNENSALLIDVDGKETWMNCTSQVKSFANQNIKAGEAVEVAKDDKNIVNRISKAGSTASQAAPAAQPATSSSAAPSQQTQRSSTGKYRDPLTPEESRSIRHQSVMSSACVAVSGGNLTAVDPNTWGDFIISLYRQLLAEVEK